MIRRIFDHLRRKADDAAIKQAMFKAQREGDRIKREKLWRDFTRDADTYGDARDFFKANLPDRFRRADGSMGDDT